MVRANQHNMRIMQNSAIGAALLVLAACGGSEMAVQTPAAPKVEPAPAQPAPSSTNGTESVARDPACMGSKLNLDALAALDNCQTNRTGDRLPASVQLHVPAKIEAISGRPASIPVELHNTATVPVDLYIDASCHFTNFVTTEIRTGHGQRIDRVGGQQCERSPRCVGEVLHVTLAAGGRAELLYALATRVALESETCETFTGRALQASVYQAHIQIDDREPIKVRLAVTAEEFLPLSQCERYAKELALQAEPDPARRSTIADQVAAQCRQTPPTMQLVRCQRAARDETSLARCRAETDR